jgi:hypothetical protein
LSGVALEAWIWGYVTACENLRTKREQQLCEASSQKWVLTALLGLGGGFTFRMGIVAIRRGAMAEAAAASRIPGLAGLGAASDALWAGAISTVKTVFGAMGLGLGGHCAAQ